MAKDKKSNQAKALDPPPTKDFMTAAMLSLFLGWIGADRFYLGKYGTGFLKLITLGGFGVWFLLDLLLILTGSMKDNFGQPLQNRKKQLKSALIVVVVVFALGFFMSVAASGTSTLNTTEDETESKAAEELTEVDQDEQTQADPEPETESKPEPVGFGDGIHIVNEDIDKGTYRSQGTGTCYWARLSGFGGELEDIIANGNNGLEIVTIASSDAAFETSGCGRWVPVESTLPSIPDSSFVDGTFKVGGHIAPGRYRADGSADDLCYWARLSDFTHAGVDGIITNGNSPTVIEISSTDAGFTATGCGTWTKL